MAQALPQSIGVPAGTTLVQVGRGSGPALPVAGFTAAPTSGTVPFAVTVTSTATGTGLTYDYDWGDGSAHSTSANPSHAYTVAGSYTITQTVTDSLGRTASTTRSITASAGAGLAVGAQITSLAVKSVSGSGSRPYAATVLLRPGQVPSGSHITNSTGTEKAAIGATYPDGSAAWVVLPGEASADGTVAVHVATGTAPADLTAAAVAAAGVTSVAINFGGSYGAASITSFGSPERVWWATPTYICVSYRIPAPTPGGTALEAVIYVHAWAAGRALVEVVFENAKVDCTQTTVAKPSAATYTGATISVNGTTALTFNSGDVPIEAAHSWSRAVYASAWVGGNPGLRVHQSVADLQQHPLLFKMDQASSADLSGYAADAYAPWANGRIPAANMGGVGDVDAIGPLTKWDAQWLQSGDYRAASAVEQNALCALSFNINSRSAATGRVPTFTEIDLKSANGNHTWPLQSNGNSALEWELMHHPAVGLAAFLVRPSPVFIEVAQKIAVWNAMWQTNFDRSTVQPTGVFRGPSSTRGRAWGIRSLTHAIFLTPDGDAWKAPAKTNLAANVTYLDGYRTSADSKLGICWEGDPDLPATVDGNVATDGAAFSTRGWFSHYLITEVHKAASVGLLAGASQTALATLADWLCTFPVRWINEQPNGGWRYIPYTTVIGRNATTMDQPATWAEMRAYVHSDIPAARTGTWYFATGNVLAYGTDYGNTDTNRPRYVDYFWAALVAAVERGIAGSRAAWYTVNAEVSNLATWRAGFGLEPRWGSAPKAVAESYGALETQAAAVSSGAWLDITDSTTAKLGRDSTLNDSDIAPLEGSGAGPGNGGLAYKPLMNWGGNLTWRAAKAELAAVGATNGFSSDSPAGNHTAELRLPLATLVFARAWAIFASNIAHQYDANSTADSPLGPLRRSYGDAGLYRKAAGSWSYLDHTGSGKMGIGTAYAVSADYHPRYGKCGSHIVIGFNAALGRFDEKTQAQSQLSALVSGVGDNSICAYHPAIDKVLFGFGTGGTTLYSVDSSGTVASFTTNMPPGVTEISCRDVINAVLAPDPQGRAYAWLYDFVTTRKVWRLDLVSKTWTEQGAIPAGVSGYSCVGTVPPLGIHVILSSGAGRAVSTVSDGKVWVFRPGSDFASGSGTGSYNSGTFTWTPAKTGGVVNAASWAIVPTSTWVKVAGSNLDAQDAAVRAAVPSWTTEQLAWGGITESWSGTVADQYGGRMWILGGGHTNGFNNLLSRFDLFKMAWTPESLPSPRTAEWTSSGYASGSSSTEYPPSAAAFQADIAGSTWQPINGSWYDQLQDGKPTARHTYQFFAYDSKRGRVILMSRRMWVYDPSSALWVYRRAFNDQSSGGDGPTFGGASFMDNENGVCVYDEVNDEALVWSSGSGGANTRIRYAFGTASWNTTWPNVTWNNAIVYSCRNGRKLVSVAPNAGGIRYWVHDLDTKTNDVSSVNATLGAGLTTTYWNWTSAVLAPEWSVEYIAGINRYWLMTYTAANAWELLELDPTTTPWTLRKVSQAGTFPTQPYTLYRRLTYWPGINAVTLMGYADQPLAVFKLP